MKKIPAAVEGRLGMTRRIALAAAAVIALLAAALLVPSVALAQGPTSGSDPYAAATTDPYGSTTEETTPTDETTTTEETTPTDETTTTEETTPTDETTPTEETTPTDETTTTEETTPTDETTTTEETTPTETTSSSSEVLSTSGTVTSPAELGVFDPGPCTGAYVTAAGSGFAPGEPIELKRDGVTISTVAAGSDGSFSVRVDIAGVQNGAHTITATGTTSGFTATGTFDVEPQVCTSSSGSAVVIAAVGSRGAVVVVATGDSLASTGFPVAPVLATGLLALLGGAMLLVSGRRRRGVAASLGTPDSSGPRHL